jgi:hypothetical protein
MRSYYNHEDGFYMTYRAMGRGASSEAAPGRFPPDHPQTLHDPKRMYEGSNQTATKQSLNL